MAGETIKPASLSAFSCPACGGNVQITARGITITVFCTHCGAEIDANNDKMKLVRRAHANETMTVKPLLQIGKRGRLDDILWEVIGFLQRSDKTGHYKWQEYLLFNPAQGFRWLIENRGHWMLFRKITPEPAWPDTDQMFPGSMRQQGREFAIFERGDAVVRQVVGEFYWRVKRGDKSRVADYIAPPFMLSHEIIKSGRQCENLWSLGEYLEPEIVRDAFSVQDSMPPRYGPGPSQPNKHRGSAIFATVMAVLFTIIMIAIQNGIESNDPERKIYATTLTAKDAGKTLVGEPFAISSDHTVLRLDIISSLNNEWAELDLELINDDTGEVRHVNKGVEYWSGYQDGYFWREGSSHAEAIVSPVAKGKWHVNADYSTSRRSVTSKNEIKTHLEIFQGAYSWGNFWLAMLALWLPVVAIGTAAYLFDVNRWSMSDYSPYQSDDE